MVNSQEIELHFLFIRLLALDGIQPGQLAVARFSEDELLYRCIYIG